MFNEEHTAFNIVQRVVGMVSVNVKGGNYKNVIHTLQGRVEDFRIPVAVPQSLFTLYKGGIIMLI